MSRTTRHPVRAIVAASSGNLVEWFDFYAYSFTSLYFAAAFFPKGDATSQLLNTAGIFALGFFMRPLGSWLFGRIADRSGRRAAMLSSVVTMGCGSRMVASLPTYSTIGRWAALLLLLARLIQGLSVGGEYGTSATYMSEVALPGRRGYYASFQYMTLIGGQLLATIVLVILQIFLSTDDLKAWGWRIPFLVGAVAAFASLYLRSALDESTTESDRSRPDAGTIRGSLRHRRALLTVFGITAGSSATFYTFTTYMQKYLVNTLHLGAKAATTLMTVALFVFMMVQPVFGALSDRIGRKTSMVIFGVIGTLTTVPIMAAIGHAPSAGIALTLVVAALLGSSFYTSISGIVKAELFPTEVRALAMGLSYALANALFGGTIEYVALWFKSHQMEPVFFYYVSGLAAVALIASISLPDQRATYIGD
jgi:MHS family alpha-ketoglutarate permease-like MFS transporter